MGFLNAVSLLVVFSLSFLTHTEAVPADRKNATVYGNATLSTNVGGNVTKESLNATSPHNVNNTKTTVNSSEEIPNHTAAHTISRNQPTNAPTALSAGQQNYGVNYKNVLQTMQLEHGMKMEDLTSLLRKFGMDNCSRVTNNHMCVTAKTLFKFYNINKKNIVSEEEFSQISTILLYVLLPTDSPKTLTNKVDVYEELTKLYSTNELCEQILDQVLNNLNKSIGKQLQGKQCFSAYNILEELNISVKSIISKAMIPKLSMNIISKLLQQQCIKVEYQNPLPCPSYFGDNLFKEYAQNDVIYKADFLKLMENLKLEQPKRNESGFSAPENKLARKKREAVKKSPKSQISPFPKYAQNRSQDANIYEKCYSVDELFSIYHINENTGLKMKTFKSISIALLDQIEGKLCGSEEIEDVNDDEEDEGNEKLSEMSVWGFGLAAVSTVSLISLFMIIPLLRTTFYRKSLVFLISLAIGTLVGDSIFYLLPRACGFQGKKDYYWRFFSILGGIYGFFLFETTAHLLLRQTHTVQITPKNKKYIEKNTMAPKSDDTNRNKMEKPAAFILANKAVEKEPTPKFNGNDFEMEDDDEKHIAPMAWTVIIGDTLHNIADGIAIGVAFGDSIAGGVGTSIAVLCHEVPHELGDFVVLLSAGMSVRQAVLANFVSSCFCFMGLVFGKLVGEIEDGTPWILGVTGGFFLYIALTNKLPELMHVTEQSDQSKITLFLLQNIGVILGFGGMFFLAYYKKDINI